MGLLDPGGDRRASVRLTGVRVKGLEEGGCLRPLFGVDIHARDRRIHP